MLGHVGMIPLINHIIPVRENSEVVIISPDLNTSIDWSKCLTSDFQARDDWLLYPQKSGEQLLIA